MGNRKGFAPVILIAVLALVIAVGGVGIGLVWRTNRLDRWLPPNIKEMFGRGERPEELEEEPGEEPEEPEPAKPSELKSLDETWNKYINYQLGFSIKVPKKVAVDYGGGAEGLCEYGEELVPVKIFEDTDSNRVYIDSEYGYSGCDKVLNSLDLLEFGVWQVWMITMEEIASDAELDTFIKEHYGSKCGLGKKGATGQEGVYDVEIQAEDGGLSAGVAPECFINFWYVLKYSPAKNKAFHWALGQMGVVFASSLTGQLPGPLIEYDDEMIKSFRFLE